MSCDGGVRVARLLPDSSALANRARRHGAWQKRTAMSGLSARTYSCGGDGDRFLGGGDGDLGDCSDTLEKNFRMPPFLGAPASLPASSSSSEGTGESEESEERSEESSSEAILQCLAAPLLLRMG